MKSIYHLIYILTKGYFIIKKEVYFVGNKINYCKDAQIIMTTTYSRKSGKSVSKRNCNYVICGILMSSLIFSMALTGCSNGSATKDLNVATKPQAQQVVAKDAEVNYTQNLNLAITALKQLKLNLTFLHCSL